MLFYPAPKIDTKAHTWQTSLPPLIPLQPTPCVCLRLSCEASSSGRATAALRGDTRWTSRRCRSHRRRSQSWRSTSSVTLSFDAAEPT